MVDKLKEMLYNNIFTMLGMMIGGTVMKYYAVKEGRERGVFDTWTKCQEATKGFPNAVFKSFSSEEEAKAFLEDKDLWDDIVSKDIVDGFIVAFCDGSFDKEMNRYSYGVVLIDSEKKESTLCGYGSNEKYVSTKNIIGEVFGSINAMDWAVSNGYEKIKIYHDYEGISKWISGEWEAKSDVAKTYTSIYKAKFEGVLEVVFEHVKGHSNNKYNDKADEIAKSALEDRTKIAIQGENWFVLPHISKEDFQAVMDLIKEEYTDLSDVVTDYDGKSIYRLTLNTDSLTATVFKSSSRKLLVQGKPSLLFQIVISYISELENVNNVDKIMSSAYRKTINTKDVDNAYNTLFPAFPSDYPMGIKKLLRQAVINMSYFIESEDYTQYAFPALRALEGHIKYLITKATGKQAHRQFDTFNISQQTGKYVFVAHCIDSSKKPLIEKCYNYYKTQRDTIFHFGDIIGITDNTRIDSDKEKADEVIKDCINLICEM